MDVLESDDEKDDLNDEMELLKSNEVLYSNEIGILTKKLDATNIVETNKLMDDFDEALNEYDYDTSTSNN